MARNGVPLPRPAPPPSPSTPTCPDCDEPLVAVDQAGPSTPPWWSPGCSRLWWPTQLEDDARDLWQKDVHGYAPEHARDVVHRAQQDAVVALAKHAEQRGRGRA